MKSIFIKTCLIINLFYIYNCKAQTTNDYITFYNGVVPKLNNIVPNKTQFYGQNFSNFYNELLSKNINIVGLICDAKTDPGSKFYILKLYFSNASMWTVASENSFQYPSISITFENEIPNQVDNMIKQNQAQWNPTFVQFFSSMKIESIRFIGMNGYNSTDNSLK